VDSPDDGVSTPQNEPAAPAASSGGKYVPPSMRAGAGRGAGESMYGRGGTNRDDMPTLRVTNVPDDANDEDLRDLFGQCGRVARVYIGKDRDTGIGKGYAFVSFDEKAIAQKAIDKLNGFGKPLLLHFSLRVTDAEVAYAGYGNLILSVQWSRKLSLLTVTILN
jgi:translation initiation factor 3 subunit G